ncbi:hypothetical protein [Streptomyces sp. SAI-170]|uniref:hypothetical protein n=1 Tax=Streptomyces sp. SAI-170 TaxID=3377729 RepID=UPI003C7E1A02
MRRSIAAWLAAAALVVGAAAGCERHDGQPADRGRAAPDHTLTDAERFRLARAEQLLVQRCMTQHGFPYWLRLPLTARESRPLGYVLDDIGWAQRYGYGGPIRQKLAAAERHDRNNAYRARLTGRRLTAYDTALSGGSEAPSVSADVPGGGTVTSRLGGCELQARERLYGDHATWFRVDKTATHLSRLYAGDLVADPRFVKALRRWSSCMRAEGRTYANPAEARDALHRRTQQLPPQRAFALERELAVADATCARDVGLKAVGRKVEASYVDRLRGRYGDDLDTRRRLQRAALDRASGVTGEADD